MILSFSVSPIIPPLRNLCDILILIDILGKLFIMQLGILFVFHRFSIQYNYTLVDCLLTDRDELTL